ncbi:MAG TPA: hypothetical protein VIC56_05865 [Gemmatimonadota bacterium]|jgi:hypothetical protein
MIETSAPTPRGPLRAALALLSLIAAAPIAGASSLQGDGRPDPWVHVQVVEGDSAGATVEVHLPLSAVRLGLDIAAKEAVVDGRLQLRDSDVDVADLRRMWQELRAAGDADFVTVRDEEETVLVRRVGDRVEVRVTDRREGGEEVRVDLPVPLVDALLAGEPGAPGSLDLAGAIAELNGFRGDLVRVTEGARKVRVWIDERQRATSMGGGDARPADAPSRRLPRISGDPA